MILLLVFTEFNTSLAGATFVTLFKRGSNASTVQSTSATSNSDKEKTKVPSSTNSELDARKEDKENVHEALDHQPRMKNMFTWQHMNYEVASRQLLNDVSGYVAPGKLAALMGESPPTPPGIEDLVHRHSLNRVWLNEASGHSSSLAEEARAQFHHLVHLRLCGFRHHNSWVCHLSQEILNSTNTHPFWGAPRIKQAQHSMPTHKPTMPPSHQMGTTPNHRPWSLPPSHRHGGQRACTRCWPPIKQARRSIPNIQRA